ncbi:hypothetical protein CDAR_25622, partial [Caerostris darwini]
MQHFAASSITTTKPQTSVPIRSKNLHIHQLCNDVQRMKIKSFKNIEDERKADSFGETFKDGSEDPALFETLLRVQVGRNMQNRPGTGNATSSDRPADLFHRMLGPRNPISSDIGAEGGQNAVRSSENLQQSADYCFSQRTSNKKNLSNANDSLIGCSVWNKKMRYSEINPNESSRQPLGPSIRGTSYKADMTSGGESSSSHKIQ